MVGSPNAAAMGPSVSILAARWDSVGDGRSGQEVRVIRIAAAMLVLFGGVSDIASPDSPKPAVEAPGRGGNAAACLQESTVGSRFGAQCGSEVEARVASALEPGEARLWEGEWLSTDSDVEDNVYEMLTVVDADASGFTYRFECRDVPYGANSRSIDEARASYRGPLRAEDGDAGRTFRLSVDPGDPDIRSIETEPRWYEPVGCALSDAGPSNEFVYLRTTFNAGFDCGRAVTPVEVAICGQELIALGDREMTEAYRMVRAASSTEDGTALLASQRAWLKQRNGACVGDDEVVDDVCLARTYSDRLVELARVDDPGLGAGPRLDSAYAMALFARGADVGLDTAVRLAMYPLVVGTSKWRANAGGILFESTHTETRMVWPSDVEFRYSQMLFVGSDGTVWIARHIEPLLDVGGINRHQVWIEAGGDPFMIRSDNGFESDGPPPASVIVPELVRSWLIEHPIAESMR